MGFGVDIRRTEIEEAWSPGADDRQQIVDLDDAGYVHVAREAAARGAPVADHTEQVIDINATAAVDVRRAGRCGVQRSIGGRKDGADDRNDTEGIVSHERAPPLVRGDWILDNSTRLDSTAM